MSNFLKKIGRKASREKKHTQDAQRAACVVDYLCAVKTESKKEIAKVLRNAETNPLLKDTITQLNRMVVYMIASPGMDPELSKQIAVAPNDEEAVFNLILDNPMLGPLAIEIFQRAADEQRG